MDMNCLTWTPLIHRHASPWPQSGSSKRVRERASERASGQKSERKHTNEAEKMDEPCEQTMKRTREWSNLLGVLFTQFLPLTPWSRHFFFWSKSVLLPILGTWILVPEIYLPPKAFYIGPSLLVPHKYRNRKRFEIKSLHRKRFTAAAQWFKTVWNRKYWDTRSSARLFACTAHSFACSALLALLTRPAAPTRSLARSLTRSLAHETVEYFFPIFKVSWIAVSRLLP